MDVGARVHTKTFVPQLSTPRVRSRAGMSTAVESASTAFCDNPMELSRQSMTILVIQIIHTFAGASPVVHPFTPRPLTRRVRSRGLTTYTWASTVIPMDFYGSRTVPLSDSEQRTQSRNPSTTKARSLGFYKGSILQERTAFFGKRTAPSRSSMSKTQTRRLGPFRQRSTRKARSPDIL